MRTLSVILFTSSLATVQAQFGAQSSVPVMGPILTQVLDVDGDGDNDLFISSRDGSMVLLNTDGQGSLSAPVVLSASDITGCMADLNGDGAPDLVGGQMAGAGLHWRANTGTMGFAPVVTLATGVTAETFVAFDADGDGDLDLVALLDDTSLQYFENTNGLGAFAPMVNIGWAAPMATLNVCDADLDGDLDILWNTPFADETSWCMNTGGTVPFAGNAIYVADARVLQVDADGDGQLDRVLVRNGAQQAVWQRGNATGIDPATERLIEPTLEWAGSFLMHDMDGDGDLDLVAGNVTTNEVCFYPNIDGQGTYGARQVVAANIAGAFHLAAGDLDGDGDPELVATGLWDNTVYWWENLSRAGDLIVGRVFNDVDNDGDFGHEDHGLYNMRVDVPGLGITFTNHSGMYWFGAGPGTYSVTHVLSIGWQPTTPTTRPAQINSPGQAALGVDFGVKAIGTNHHLVGSVVPGPQRCNMTAPYGLTVINTGNQTTDISLTLDLNDLSGYVSATPAPSLVNGGFVTWTFQNVHPTHHRHVSVIVQMPDQDHMDELLVDQLALQAHVNGTAYYSTVVAAEGVLTCAYDPNDKQVMPAGVGPTFLTAMNSLLTYTVRFQNTGNAVAYDVRIEDQLDPSLDPNTLTVIGHSHTMRTHIADNGLITFSFDNIMLPDSNSNEPESHGYVRYTIRAHSGLPEGTPVYNTAGIFFDLNPAIITNTTLSTLTYGMTGVEEVAGASPYSVFPNPVTDRAVVHMPEGAVIGSRLILTDALGREVRAWRVSGDRTEIDVNGLPDGLYLLRNDLLPAAPALRVLVGR
ncbi:MAG: T9SS type A sorting domain-containing protein [Flavobacteriales bacterium]|nr:T9SS type A sorting domain-containing protein [Flavobacteriales bacterium]